MRSGGGKPGRRRKTDAAAVPASAAVNCRLEIKLMAGHVDGSVRCQDWVLPGIPGFLFELSARSLMKEVGLPPDLGIAKLQHFATRKTDEYKRKRTNPAASGYSGVSVLVRFFSCPKKSWDSTGVSGGAFPGIP